MKALLQRVRQAQVDVDEQTVGAIDTGLLVFLGIEKHDTPSMVDKMASRVAGYRIFADEQGRMNQDVRDIQGGILVVSQFTLAADTRKGRRPSFSSAAAPEQAESLYQAFLASLEKQAVMAQAGVFAADMQVHLVNDGPVTFLLEL